MILFTGHAQCEIDARECLALTGHGAGNHDQVAVLHLGGLFAECMRDQRPLDLPVLVRQQFLVVLGRHQPCPAQRLLVDFEKVLAIAAQPGRIVGTSFVLNCEFADDQRFPRRRPPEPVRPRFLRPGFSPALPEFCSLSDHPGYPVARSMTWCISRTPVSWKSIENANTTNSPTSAAANEDRSIRRAIRWRSSQVMLTTPRTGRPLISLSDRA